MQGVRIGRWTTPPILVVVFLLLGLEMLLASTRLGTLP